MNKITKIVSLITLFLVLISQIYILSIYVHPDTGTQEKVREIKNVSAETENNYTEDQEKIPTQEEYSPVLCEIGTATWCKYCPEMEKKIYEIYDSGKYPIYIVSLVYDKSKAAKNRLEKDYNIYGFPTLFIDGGRKVIFGSDVGKSEIEKQIKNVAERPKKDISIDLDVSLEDNESLDLKLRIKNKEDSDYSGKLKVYLVEINSRWYDYDGKPYRFALLDFIIDREIYLDFGEDKTITSTWRISNSLKPVNKDNLMIIATLFSDESKVKYSDPPENKRSFSARYVDYLVAKRIGEGNLPPQVGISIPREGMLHLRSKPLFKMPFGRTIVIGKTYLDFTVRDDGDYVKIKIYVDGEIKKIIVDNNFNKEEEYRFILPHPLLGNHNVMIEVYDKNGKKGKAELDLWCFKIFN